jgi:hypothetical protein
MGPQDLPTVVLKEGAMYWVKPRYGADAERWTVARWEVGCFWGVGGGEVAPAIICGPIPNPAESSLSDLAAKPTTAAHTTDTPSLPLPETEVERSLSTTDKALLDDKVTK